MAAVVIVGRRARDDGYTEVTLSKDLVRFTVVVPQRTEDLPESYALYEVMAQKVLARHGKVTGIVDLIRKT